MTPGAVTLRTTRVATNGIELSVTEAGPTDGSLVILLHGFPESWFGWRHQVDPLVAAGFRVVMPDQRGYGGSDKPSGVASYRLELLVADVLGLISAYGRERVALVGHDWGGIVAWAAIEQHPERFDRAVILNAPHPAVMQRVLRQDLRQIRKSWYVFAFQIPGLPEILLQRHQFRALERSLIGTSRPGGFDQADIDHARTAWSQPGALRSMVHWYRASFRSAQLPLPDPPIAVPTQIIWGTDDQSLDSSLARLSYAQCQDATLAWIADASHWVAHEQPERVNQLMVDFLSRSNKESEPRTDRA